ncbi:MAG: hypothetical protein ACRD99_01845 [Nitrososphaera sp.]
MRKYFSEAFLAAFALLISTTAVSAYAQGMPEEVSGTYSTPDGGVTITFPDGWSGFPFGTGGMQMVSVIPGGMEAGGDMQKAMMLIVADKSEVDPTDPGSFSPTEDAPDCSNPPTPTETTVSGKKGFEMTMECTDDEGQTTKMKMTIAETADKWIAFMYISPPAEFDADLGKYDAAVDTIQIQGAVDATVPVMPSGDGGTTDDGEVEAKPMPVMVAGESVDVSVESTSTISAFMLDEATKTLSFKADGTGDMTVVSVGSVLEGPYTVMVDGQATTEFEETTDAEGVKTISVPHSSGAHDVTITGTQVVPEFPIALLGIVAALIAIVSVVGRTRLVKGRF